MVIYEFECTVCHERLEVSRAMSQHDELKQHPPAFPKCDEATTREMAPLVRYKPPSNDF
jgi:putative FmdB family regulatory protein